MFRKGLTVVALAICSAATLVGTASTAKAVDNPFELTLSGSGASDTRFHGLSAGGSGSIGYYFTDNIELGLRQTANYSDLGGVSLTASSRGFFDFNIPLGDHNQIVPFVGVNAGYSYGKGVKDTGEAAGEAGIKYYINSTTFIYGSAEYQFFFKKGDSGAAFKDGALVYGLGVGFRL